MANKKEINPKSGERLKELLSDLNMTQEQFGLKIGLGARQISCIVTGVRRLTEENARLIARLFPNVRYEWLMGYDDYKTDVDFRYGQLERELYDVRKDLLEFYSMRGCTENIVASIGYKFTDVSLAEMSEEEKLKIKNENALFQLKKILMDKGNDIFLKIFDEVELTNIRERVNSYRGEAISCLTISQLHEMTECEREEYRRARVEHSEEIIEKEKNMVSFITEQRCKTMDHERYCLCDKTGKILIEFTPSEAYMFMQQLHDVVDAMIMYYINKHHR